MESLLSCTEEDYKNFDKVYVPRVKLQEELVGGFHGEWHTKVNLLD